MAISTSFLKTLYITETVFSELDGFNGLVLCELSIPTTKLKAFMSAAQRQQFYVHKFIRKFRGIVERLAPALGEKVGMIRSAHNSDFGSRTRRCDCATESTASHSPIDMWKPVERGMSMYNLADWYQEPENVVYKEVLFLCFQYTCLAWFLRSSRSCQAVPRYRFSGLWDSGRRRFNQKWQRTWGNIDVDAWSSLQGSMRSGTLLGIILFLDHRCIPRCMSTRGWFVV